MKFIVIDGKRYVWREIVRMRKLQLDAFKKAHQPPLFEMRHDVQPAKEQSAADRYIEPSLFA